MTMRRKKILNNYPMISREGEREIKAGTRDGIFDTILPI